MKWLTRGLLIAAVLILASCAHQPAPSGNASFPGFALGMLHGYISLFTLGASLFTDVRIYAFPNSGFFYDLGFIIGAIAFYGSGHRTYVYSRGR